ncbi:MAG: hypothetical protein LC721_07735 [Actinobacteria bacterium]|nr:hypothetical protein [Actinomycetota bacterium]
MTCFCYDTRVWLTNNISERNLRPAKSQQKISRPLTSEDTTQDRLNIRGYLDTARKCDVHVMTALRDAVAARPHLTQECQSPIPPPAPTAPAPSP